MTRITFVGAGFLCLIAIIPSCISIFVLSNLPYQDSNQISQFLGGTSLLIVISVMLDFVNRIEANLVMRNYGGFMEDSGSGPTKIKRNKESRSSSKSRGDLPNLPGYYEKVTPVEKNGEPRGNDA